LTVNFVISFLTVGTFKSVSNTLLYFFPLALQPSAGWLWPPLALQPSAGYGLLWLCSRARATASSFMRFLDHTQRRATVGRTPMDE
jgi:hypothetical protein